MTCRVWMLKYVNSRPPWGVYRWCFDILYICFFVSSLITDLILLKKVNCSQRKGWLNNPILCEDLQTWKIKLFVDNCPFTGVLFPFGPIFWQKSFGRAKTIGPLFPFWYNFFGEPKQLASSGRLLKQIIIGTPFSRFELWFVCKDL